MYNLNVSFCKQLTEISIYFGSFCTIFCSSLLGTFLHDITECNHFYLRLFGQAWQMLTVCNATASDHGNF
ncbi:hypothetical protein D3C80_1857220 [compost metagenome]